MPYPIPETTGDGLLGQVEHAAASYYHAVNVVLSADQAAAVAVWGQRRQRLLAWLQVLHAGEDLNRAVGTLAGVEMPPGERDSATTVFDEISRLFPKARS